MAAQHVRRERRRACTAYISQRAAGLQLPGGAGPCPARSAAGRGRRRAAGWGVVDREVPGPKEGPRPGVPLRPLRQDRLP